jgi:heme-degrading monooxygenase HmoA
MSVVKINAITIPEGMGPQLEGRFAGRAKMVEAFEGFEDFQLLRPTPNQESGENRYFVYTRWTTEAHFQAWMDSQDFAKGHGTGQADAKTDGEGEGEQAPKPVAQGADLMSFDVVEHVVKGA